MSFVTDNLEDWERLADWLNQQREARHLSLRAIAREAGIAHSVVANMANAQGPFTAKTLNAVADALGVPRETVQRLAGLLPDHGEVLPEARDWSARLMALSEETRQRAVSAMEGVLVAFENAASPPRR